VPDKVSGFQDLKKFWESFKKEKKNSLYGIMQ
jgi:hypothetical protein